MKSVIKRILGTIPVLIGVVLLIFIMLRIVPGNAAAMLLGEHVDQATIDRLTEVMGLDKPVIVQFFDYLAGAIHGDLGISYKYNRAVTDMIMEAFPYTLELALLAARALSDKKGKEIQALEIADLTTLADYFVLATGSSNTQINALVDNVEKVLHEEAGEDPLHREGYRGGTWVLLDYGCVVVHVFNDEARKFYSLEHLWADGEPIDISEYLTPDHSL